MCPMVKSLARRAGLQQPWLQTSRIPGRITQLLDDLTAVIGWRTWAERVFILPLLLNPMKIGNPLLCLIPTGSLVPVLDQ